jgi:succinyl-CoA synthetase beta subunit
MATPSIDHAGLIPELPRPAAPIRGNGDGYLVARDLLSDAGVRFVAQRTVTSRAAAREAARELGYPVVLKALHDGALHKSDVAGVVLGLAEEAALVRAYDDLDRRLAPPAFSVEAMAPLGVGLELLIGVRWDARFGPVVLAGTGGVYAEVFHDIAVALAPVDEVQAEAMLRSLRSAPLLLGARGRPALAIEAAAGALVALARAAAAHPELCEIEVNPLLVTSEEAIALDARFLPAGEVLP